MEIKRDAAQPLVIHISHKSYRRLLDQAAETDRRFPWLAQHRYLVCIAVVSDQDVWLELR
jgi:hypothetical protein